MSTIGNYKEYSIPLQTCFEKLSNDVKDLYLGENIFEMSGILSSPLSFYREWVSYNRPIIFRGAIKHWPAFKKWQFNEYFRSMMGEEHIDVSVTPDGYADAVCDNKFIMPLETEISMNNFLDILEASDKTTSSVGDVYYIQKQNSNFTSCTSYKAILNDIIEPSWATEAFGSAPDAVNFWMGDKRAITSMHKDPYENIYCVVRGFKDILLHPPSDIPWIPYDEYPSYVYVRNASSSKLCPVPTLHTKVPWIGLDPLSNPCQRYPLYANATPYRCRLHAGDVLYLPSLWFHHLQQSHGCIAINYWYDMSFDPKYCYLQFLQQIKMMDPRK